MKLATLKDSTRDGRLHVVSRDLSCASPASVRTLQEALDDWANIAPVLQTLADSLESGDVPGTRTFRQEDCQSPLPRAYGWCDGSAYLSHAELVRQARNAEMPQSLYSDPLIYQGGSDIFLGPRDPIPLGEEDWGLDLEAEVAVIVDDVPMGVTADQASGFIRLVMLVNDISLRNLIPSELAKQFGFFQSKPPTAFSPVALTPDELGEAWDGRRLALPIISQINGIEIGRPNAGADLNFDFAQLIAHAAKTRPLGAGTIIGSGTVSNRDRANGSSCLQEVRMIEKIETGEFKTPFLSAGDVVRIEMLDAHGASLFGAIEQVVAAAGGAAAGVQHGH